MNSKDVARPAIEGRPIHIEGRPIQAKRRPVEVPVFSKREGGREPGARPAHKQRAPGQRRRRLASRRSRLAWSASVRERDLPGVGALPARAPRPAPQSLGRRRGRNGRALSSRALPRSPPLDKRLTVCNERSTSQARAPTQAAPPPRLVACAAAGTRAGRPGFGRRPRRGAAAPEGGAGNRRFQKTPPPGVAHAERL